MDHKIRNTMNSIEGELRASQKMFKPTTGENHRHLLERYFDMLKRDMLRFGPHDIHTHMSAMRVASMCARLMIDFPIGGEDA